MISGFRHSKAAADKEAEWGFKAKQVRAGLKLSLGKHLRAKTSFELTDGIDRGNGVAYLRTAIIQLKEGKKLRLSVGRYKRPFSRLELWGMGDLPITSRGLLNETLIEDSAWGDRAIGAMISGLIKPIKLRWAASFTNPPPTLNGWTLHPEQYGCRK